MKNYQLIAQRLTPILPRRARIDFCAWLSVYLLEYKQPKTMMDILEKCYTAAPKLETTKDLSEDAQRLILAYLEQHPDEHLKQLAFDWYDNRPK